MRLLRGWLLALLLIAPLPATTQEEEHIRDFAVRIEIQPDGAVEVTEDIEVLAQGQQIRRGIFRELYLSGMSDWSWGTPAFTLHEALRNGVAEPHHTERTDGRLRIYLGDRSRMIEPGMHRYRLRYRMADQVRRLDDADEIYWNVNGTGWPFATRRVSAEVVLPPGATILRHAGYTGSAGESGQDFTVEAAQHDRLLFATTRMLAPRENLTVAVAFPTGIVAVYEGPAPLIWLMRQDPLHATGALGLAVLLYYGIVWWRVGRDPKGGPIAPVYVPALSPAAMRYLQRMGFDDECVAAALISLAVKGCIVFEEEANGRLLLRRVVPPDGAPEPSPEEAALLDALMVGLDPASPLSTVALDRTNRIRLSNAGIALRTSLTEQYGRGYFRRNVGWLMGGAALTLGGWLIVSVTMPMMLFAIIEAVIIAVIVTVMAGAVQALLHLFRSAGVQGRLVTVVAWGLLGLGALASMQFLLPIGLTLPETLGWPMTVAAFVIVGINGVFYELLKVRTPRGRAAMDEIEGAERYLTVAEADRLRFHNPPERTPAHFEALLPYAIALGVETAWTGQFSHRLATAAAAEPEHEHHPAWYRGTRFNGTRIANIGSALGSHYASATRQENARSSSGGSSGRGSSGGGGGGAGGGGW